MNATQQSTSPGQPERTRHRAGGAPDSADVPRQEGPTPFFQAGDALDNARRWATSRTGRFVRSRGDVRTAVLALLAEQPRHGYDLIQQINERSAGAWTPSPGSIYPTLQALENDGLVSIDSVDGRKTARLTENGRAHAAERGAELRRIWSFAPDQGSAAAVRKEATALQDAVGQVTRVGTPQQQKAAATMLATARRELYRLLAEDATETGE